MSPDERADERERAKRELAAADAAYVEALGRASATADAAARVAVTAAAEAEAVYFAASYAAYKKSFDMAADKFVADIKRAVTFPSYLVFESAEEAYVDHYEATRGALELVKEGLAGDGGGHTDYNEIFRVVLNAHHRAEAPLTDIDNTREDQLRAAEEVWMALRDAERRIEKGP